MKSKKKIVQVSIKKEITRIREEINEIEIRKLTKLNVVFWKHKIDTLLARLRKKERELKSRKSWIKEEMLKFIPQTGIL